MRKSLFTIWVTAKIGVRRYFRDRLAIFFTVIFPLIFLFIFGGLFGKDNKVSFNVALINQSHSQFAQQFVKDANTNKLFKIKPDITTLDAAKARMSRSEIDAAIVLPSDFGEVKNGHYPTGQMVIYYDQNNEQAAQTLGSVLEGVFTGINSKFVKYSPPFTIKTKSTNTRGLSRFDYTFSGLLGFSIIGLGIFGPVNVFPELKKQGVLRRIHSTPLRVWQYFVSNVLSQAVIGLFSISVMFLVAVAFFHLKMHGNYLELAFVIVFGILTIFGIGLAVGGWAKNERQAAPLANLIVFPMMFLSGTFFPRYLMPAWLQKVSGFLPLTPVIDSIRMVVTENKHLINLGPQLGLMAIWTIIIYAIAFRVFRWE
ncbi:MAG TPA: ABC transporter permease [Candidatus Saccharimonadales bacterium]|nr:ABC transporter permease [Candidatus Saccharimonadales bacterium]